MEPSLAIGLLSEHLKRLYLPGVPEPGRMAVALETSLRPV